MSHIDACTAVADVQQRCKIQGPAPTSNSETQRQHHLLQRVGYMTTHSVIEACWLRNSRCVLAKGEDNAGLSMPQRSPTGLTRLDCACRAPTCPGRHPFAACCVPRVNTRSSPGRPSGGGSPP